MARDKVAWDLYGKKVPQFIAFNAEGKRVDDLYLADYKTKTSPLMKLLVKASKGHGTMPLTTFVKKYRSFLNDLDKLEGKKGTCAKKKIRLKAGGNASNASKPGAKKNPPPKLSKKVLAKLSKVEKEEQVIAKQEKKLLDNEKKLLSAVKAYDTESPSKEKVAKAKAAAPAKKEEGG